VETQKTPEEFQTEILTKLKNLTNYVNRLDNVISEMDLMKPKENIESLENHILMIQAQKEFVKMALQEMKDTYGNS